LALGGVALVAGLWGGLLRIGLELPVPSAAVVSNHGALMVCSFLGTVIGIERAVALGHRWAYAAPLLTGLGSVTLLVTGHSVVGVGAVVAGSLVFVAASVRIIARQSTTFTVVMALGGVAWAVGNVLWWMGRPIFDLVLWWVAFLLLTIAGERLELSRLMRRPRWANAAFVVACGLFLVGVAASVWWRDVGVRLSGAGMLALTLWLFRHDVARRTVRLDGLPRYVAVCLLSGYVWLFVAGVLLVTHGSLTAGPAYDAALHAFFVGFVFSMIFGHAPIIVPAVLRVAVPYRPSFYLALALLHASLLVRIVGDVIVLPGARIAGGTLSAVAVLLFIAIVVRSARAGDLRRRAPHPG